MRWILLALFVLSGTTFAEGILECLQARGRCRRILVHKNEVIVRFTCQEDADIFARDLVELLKD